MNFELKEVQDMLVSLSAKLLEIWHAGTKLNRNIRGEGNGPGRITRW